MFAGIEATLYPLIAILVAALLAPRLPSVRLERVERALAGPVAPWVLGLLSGLATWYIWGSLNAVPVIHDETAYLLQARLFASGRLVGAPPPLPEFFEQFHVFVTPVLSPKYLPGHALALMPGIWLGLPGLMQVVLTGITGGLLFALARRLTNPWIALAAWLLWLVTPGNLRFRPTYFSETTTGAIWLAGWSLLLRWRERDGRAALVALALLTAFGAITRPLTMVAFALPVAVVVLWRLRQTGRWADLAWAAGAGLLVLSLGPLHSRAVTGDWRTTPLSHYSTIYFPFDLPGFTVDSSPARRALPPDMQEFRSQFLPFHQMHATAPLGDTLWRRARRLAWDIFGSRTKVLLPLALVGLVAAGSAVGLGAGTGVLLLLLYLVFAHPAGWTVYYLEIHPVVTLLAAMGLWQVTAWLAAGGRGGGPWRRLRPAGPAPARALALLLLLALPGAVASLGNARDQIAWETQDQRAFRQLIEGVPGPAIVFIRYGPNHNFHYSLIANPPDYQRAPVWLVYDRGSDNQRLLRLAPGRTAYLYDEASRELRLLEQTPPGP